MEAPVVAIFGAGNRAHNTMRVVADKGKVRVKYLWDTDDHRRQWLNEQHGFGALLPDSPEICCEDPEVDAILVMTPQNARREYVEMIVPSGKTLYLDKPVAANPTDVQAIWRCLLEADVTAITGLSLRYMPGFYKVKELIASGRLGEITHVRSCQHIPAAGGLNFRRKWSRTVAASGGYLNEMGVHDIDAMIWLADSVPRSVVAMQQRSLYPPRPDRPERCSECDDSECAYRCAASATVPEARVSIGGINLSPDMQANPEVHGLDLCCYNSGHDLYDRGSMAIEMENGVLATFEFNTCCAVASREYQIMGSKGMVWGNLPTSRFQFKDNLTGDAVEYDERGKALPEVGGDPVFGDGALFDDLVSLIRTGKPPRAQVRNAALACMTIFAAEQATRDGTRVALRDMIAPDLQESLLGSGSRIHY